MDKNINYMIEKCRPFWCNRTLPQVYDDSLSFEELLYHIFAKINECIDTVNSWSELAKKLDEILKDIDATLKKEIIAILKKWYEDGTLADIIKDTLKDWIAENAQELLSSATKQQQLDMRRILSITAVMQDGNSDTIEQEHYSYCQGACTFEYGGKLYAAMYLICQNNSTSYTKNDNGNLRIYNITDQKFMCQDHFSFGHGNDMCYNPNEHCLYVAYSAEYKNSDSKSPSANVAKIKLNGSVTGMTLVDTKNFASYLPAVSSVCYDNVSNAMYIGESYKIFKITDWKSATCTPFLSLDGIIKQGERGSKFFSLDAVIQTNMVHGDYAYFLRYQPNALIRYNIKAKVFDLIYTFGECLDNGMYRTGEMEAFTIDKDDNCYIIDTQHLMYKPLNGLDMTQVFVQNLRNFNAMGTRNSVAYDQTTKTIYVDSDYKGYTPTGSTEKPFRSVAEAITFCTTSQWTRGKHCYIRPHSDSKYPCYITGYETPITIQCIGTRYNIGNVFIDAARVGFDNVSITNVVPANAFKSVAGIWQDAVVAVRAGQCTAQSNVIFHATNGYVANADYHVHLDKAIWSNVANMESSNAKFLAENSICCTHGWITPEGHGGAFNILN